jgi:hypothetical protein
MGHPDVVGAGRGRIISGIQPGTLEARTIEYIRRELSAWRDDPNRPPEESERQLNSQLCKFLAARAREQFPMACFHHEEPQSGRCSADLAVSPAETIWVGSRPHTVYHPFLVIECKRLPAPSPDREREYVTGGEKRSGGIQRFKLGLHGADLGQAAMVGYLQHGTLDGWLARINGWIAELAASPEADGCEWTCEDKLRRQARNVPSAVPDIRSSHHRTGSSPSQLIVLHHLWVQMQGGNVDHG